jgi:hypothetical protein
MIDRVEIFLNSCFEQECAVHVEYRKEDNLQAFNSAFETLDRFTINADDTVFAKIGFGLRLATKWHDKVFFEDLEFMPKVNPRFVYKISEYLLENKTIWACYTSKSNPSQGITKLMTDCFIVQEVFGELKITTDFIPDYDTKAWRNGGGYDMEYSQLGEPISVKRILSPSNDEWSIEEYNKNA